MNFIINLIVRPNRNNYTSKELGEAIFSYSNQNFKRIDFNNHIRNSRKNLLSCSWWCPFQMNSLELSKSPLIIYCHGNGGNKIDIIEIFQFLLLDFNICSFDFSGAGKSEGEFVTLGYYEDDDINSVVKFLKKELKIDTIILYGRSMGAVSALKYCAVNPNIKCWVLDSPFCDFVKWCDDILSKKLFLPQIVRNILLRSERDKIWEKIDGFDINNFQPYVSARIVQVPTIIIHGKQDNFVPIDHSRIVYNNIPESTFKRIYEVEGDHNDDRFVEVGAIVRDFIVQFSFDPVVIKEYKRRLVLKNAYNNYTSKYGININDVISNASYIYSFNSGEIQKDIKKTDRVEKGRHHEKTRKWNNFNFYNHDNNHLNENTKRYRNNSKENSNKVNNEIKSRLKTKRKVRNRTVPCTLRPMIKFENKYYYTIQEETPINTLISNYHTETINKEPLNNLLNDTSQDQVNKRKMIINNKTKIQNQIDFELSMANNNSKNSMMNHGKSAQRMRSNR